MKTSIKYVLVLFASFLLQTTINAQQPLAVRLQLKWKHQFQFAGYYAAIEKGFYKEAGIEVLLIEAAEGHNPSDAVFDGKAEFGVCTSDILLMRSHGKPAVVLATIFQHSPQILIASKASGIYHVHDLAGKRIAMEPNAADIIAFMHDEGITLDMCTLDQHAYDANALLNGHIDAISAYSTDELFVVKQSGFDYNIISPVMGGIDFYGDVLFTTEELIKSNPELVAGFRKASLKGWAYAMSNPEEIIELIYTKYSTRHSIEHLRFEARHMQNLLMTDVVEPGYTNPGRWESIADTYKKLKMVDSSFSTKGMLYLDYLIPEFIIPWKMIFVFILTIIIIGSIAYFFYSTTKKLKNENIRRQLLEKEIFEREEKFREMADLLPQIVFETDIRGKLTYVNKQAIGILRYPEDFDVLNINTTDLYIPEDRMRAVENIRRRMAGELEGNFEYTMQRYDGSLMNVLVYSNSIIRNDKPIGLRGIIIDISERKQAEYHIKRKNEELQKLNAEKDKFFSIIAHDLKSPFNSIVGFSDLLAEQVKNKEYEGIEKYSTIVLQSSQRAMDLLMNLMEWSQSQTGRMEFNPKYFELVELINDTELLLSGSLEQKSISISKITPSHLPLFADKKMIETVLRNLISNAIKFTFPGGNITISVEEKLNELLVSISDTGVGISKANCEKLFRIDQTYSTSGTNKEKGTGLGLILCLEFVEKHGGKIWVESEEGKGSTFHFTIPIRIANSLHIDISKQ
jgi:PAS domain S-box-containing protein